MVHVMCLAEKLDQPYLANRRTSDRDTPPGTNYAVNPVSGGIKDVVIIPPKREIQLLHQYHTSRGEGSSANEFQVSRLARSR